jgi:hypothetical protein
MKENRIYVRQGRKIIVSTFVEGLGGFVAVATCNPSDRWDANKGMALADARLDKQIAEAKYNTRFNAWVDAQRKADRLQDQKDDALENLYEAEYQLETLEEDA